MSSSLAECIGCGCDDLDACPGGCWWLRVDYSDGTGVCSECVERIEEWEARNEPKREPCAFTMPLFKEEKP